MNIIGIWRLVETRGWDQHGKPTRLPYGPEPLGTVTFHANGRMIAVLCDNRVSLGAEDMPREYNSYGGAYTFDGQTLVTKVDMSADPERMGSEQVRKVVFNGGRMSLFPPPRPWRGLTEHRELIWEKVA